ncbi:hypothetical protein AB0L65_48330 [Nonomuraea sp. NPDC052116]|uniref:hypothetical protein n=1 Tax=Nonomuraea sp. NPDC052116 TaxID=3155665 RepID=UPI0034483A82
MRRILGLAVAAVLAAGSVVAIGSETSPAAALDNGLARTPQMGWNDWNSFGCNVNDSLIRQTADAMVSSGMAAAGYTYVEEFHHDLGVVGAVGGDRHAVRAQPQCGRGAGERPRGRFDAPELAAVPVPGPQREAEVVDEAHAGHVGHDAAVMHAAPEHDARPPGVRGFDAVGVVRAVGAGAVLDRL